MSVVETTTFRLADGTHDVDFLAADRRVQNELIPNQPGFLRRTMARRGPDCLVVTLWWSEEQAAAYTALARDHPIQVGFEQHILPGSIVTSRYETLD